MKFKFNDLFTFIEIKKVKILIYTNNNLIFYTVHLTRTSSKELDSSIYLFDVYVP